MTSITLPYAIGIRVDDVGWRNGADDRWCGRPSRSGIPRLHHPSDAAVINEIGRGLGTKILCALVLGDWDVKNRLRGVPHVTWDEEGWDAASLIEKDRAFFEETKDILDGGEYLELAVHGLQHGYYENGKQVHERFLYPFLRKNEKGVLVAEPLPAPELDRMLELFFAIYNDWGFKKKICASWQVGNACYGTPDDDYNREFSRILNRYGIGAWQWGGWPEDVMVREGMIYLNSTLGSVTWDAYGVDPKILHNYFEAGRRPGLVPNIRSHLANYIRFQPEKNFEYVPDWIDYFKRITSPFGAMLARDNEESASQAVYARYSAVDRIDGGYRIDLSGVDAVRTFLVEDHFYIALRERRIPSSCTGGSLSVHAVRDDHTIYRIERDGSPVVVLGM